jgi:hypothetical protein
MTERAAVPASVSADRPAGKPFLHVLRGNPTAEQVAALVAVLLARGSDTPACPVRPPRSAWGDPAGALRRRSRHRGPDGTSRRLPHT